MIYLAGYTSRKPAMLKAIVERLGARLIDIRYSPNSRVPQWRQKVLVELVGDAYYHLPSLGNERFREKVIWINNFDAGENWIFWYMREHPNQPLILLCACKDAATCHRTVVGNALTAKGYQVQELDWAM